VDDLVAPIFKLGENISPLEECHRHGALNRCNVPTALQLWAKSFSYGWIHRLPNVTCLSTLFKLFA